MGFDLLTNPFAVLGLPNSATTAAVTIRVREVGHADASAAGRALLSPRTRLSAELGFLPEATQEQVDACLSAVAAVYEPDLEALSLVARANVLAHRASSRSATPKQLRDLIGIQEAIPASARSAIDIGRADAKIPPVPQDMMDAALQSLSSQHADALVEGAMTLPDGAEFLSDLVRTAGQEITPRVLFIRQCSAGWERANSSRSAKNMELAEALEVSLQKQPDAASANELSRIIRVFALGTKPPRETAMLLGLEHEASIQARRRWQSVALDLNNRLDAVAEAVAVFDALAEGFGSSGELGQQIERNRAVCRERLVAGDGNPAMRRLSQAIAVADEDLNQFDRYAMIDGRPTSSSPKFVVELHDSFCAVTTKAASNRPWLLLRDFCLRLHNKYSSTRAAWALTEMAIRQATLNPDVAGEILPLL